MTQDFASLMCECFGTILILKEHDKIPPNVIVVFTDILQKKCLFKY
jgi:hypothetical protein